MGLITTKQFDALVKRVTTLETNLALTDASVARLTKRLNTADVSINYLNSKINVIDVSINNLSKDVSLFHKVFKDIETKHELMTNGPTIGDIDYTAHIISEDV